MEKSILETNRFILQEWEPDDIAELKKILQDKEVMWAYNNDFSDQDCQSWLSWNLNSYQAYGFGLWKIINKETSEVVGECGITMQTVNERDYPEIGYHVKKEYWNQGIATEVAKAVRDFGFKELNLAELIIISRDINLQSMNIAIKSGFTIKQRFLKDNCIPHYMFCLSSK
ncbi:GNAT family N-acetyltransferase [Streptococcus uberis]|uniref:GNAT family N-acetyltransferase n=1 Tax=Streptococcus uberis TaxID=1349 RepID=UPI0012B505EE|nr:GNAT family N-acetyltransferase [Streptococcus uberis]MTB47961.1 GNAT family N-acetyltransferase [Streptococcus uberis]